MGILGIVSVLLVRLSVQNEIGLSEHGFNLSIFFDFEITMLPFNDHKQSHPDVDTDQ